MYSFPRCRHTCPSYNSAPIEMLAHVMHAYRNKCTYIYLCHRSTFSFVHTVCSSGADRSSCIVTCSDYIILYFSLLASIWRGKEKVAENRPTAQLGDNTPRPRRRTTRNLHSLMSSVVPVELEHNKQQHL